MKTRPFEKLTLSTADADMAQRLYQAFSNDGFVKVGDKVYKVESFGSVHGGEFGPKTTVDAVLVPWAEEVYATEPTVTVLDLSNPPEGATHYNPRNGLNPFRKRPGDLCFAWRSGDKSWVLLKGKSHERRWVPLCPQWFGRVQRQTFSAQNPQHQQIPKPAQWDGEGLPPVGIDCAYGERSLPVRVLAHQDGTNGTRFAVGQHGEFGSLVMGEARFFRPIKTVEQLAAEQREAAVQRVCDRFALFGTDVAIDWKALFGQMYECGMRFPEEK